MLTQRSTLTCYRVIIVVSAFLLYVSTLAFDFTYDDAAHVIYNPLVTAPDASVSSFSQIFWEPTPPGNLYRPLTTLSYRIDFLVWGLYPPLGFHLCNVLLYTLTCLLLFELLLPLIGDGLVSFLGTLLFAIHPLHVEAVANVTGRSEILAAFFGISCCLFFSESIAAKKIKSRRWLALSSGVSLLLAVLSKESAITLMPLAPVYGAIVARKRGRRNEAAWLAATAIVIILPLLALVLRYQVLGRDFVLQADPRFVYAENPLFHLAFGERLIAGLKVLGDYLALLVLPLNLSADYSVMPADLFAEVYSTEGLCALSLLFVYCLLVWSKRGTAAGFLGLWFLVTFALTSNILLPIGTIMGERLAFLPSVGCLTFICVLLMEFLKRYSYPKIIAAAVLLYCGGLTMLAKERIPVWENNEALFSQTVLDAPRSPKAPYTYAVHLIVAKKELERAEVYLRRAIELNPNYYLALRALADVALEKREYGKLEYWYRRILEVKPEDQQVKEQLEKLQSYKQDGNSSPDNAATTSEGAS